jgi:hypothetical protein
MARSLGLGGDALRAVADDVVEAAFVPQLELLGLPETEKVRQVRERRAGRPVGARNRRSEDVARHVIETLGDPLLRQAAVATMPVEELMAATGMTAAEAMAEQRLAAALVLPFLHRRMPVQVDVNTRQFIALTIVDGMPETIEGHASDIVGIQQVSEAADGQV